MLISNKWIKYGIIIILILSIFIIVPSPINQYHQENIHLKNDQWNFIVLQEGPFHRIYNQNYPIYMPYVRVAWQVGWHTSYSNVIQIFSHPESKSYLQAKFHIPKGKSNFSYTSNKYNDEIILIDYKNKHHNLTKISNNVYDLSPYGGQNVEIRIIQKSPPEWHVYRDMKVHIKPNTLQDNLMIILTGLIYIILFSLSISFFMAYSGSSIFIQFLEKSQIWFSKKYTMCSKNENNGFFTKYFLKPSFLIINKILHYADKISNPKTRMIVKIFTVICLPIVFIYIVNMIVFYIVIILISIVITIVIFLIIIALILGLLGINPSGSSVGGGGGSSSGSGGGRSSSSSGAIFGSPYEETAKEESRPFKVDKETKSSEGALPFGIGGDTIYKTEYEDTSTGETVKGHGWTISEADSNARKNLKKK